MKRLVPLILFLFLSGCGYFVTKDEFAILQKHSYQLERELKATATFFSSETGELKSTAAKLDELHNNLRKSFADTNVRIDELDFALSKLKGDYENFKLEMKESFKNMEMFFKIQNENIQKMNTQISSITKNLEELRKQLATFGNFTTDLVNLKSRVDEIEKRQKDIIKIEPPQKVEKTKQQLYDESLELYNKGSFEEAIAAFEQFVILYPQDALTDNALYWIGESYYALKKFNDALVYFHRVVIDFPQADKVPSALYKEALTLKNLGMEKESEGAFRELIARFPNTKEAQEAKKRVKKR